MIAKIRAAAFLEWPLAKVVRILPDAAVVVSTVELLVEDKIYKCPVEHTVPLELSCEEHQLAVQVKGNSNSQMLLEPD